MKYAIASFDDTAETDFMPLKWLAEDINLDQIPSIVSERRIVQCYWPQWKNSARISKAKKICSDVETDWPIYNCRILSTAGMTDHRH